MHIKQDLGSRGVNVLSSLMAACESLGQIISLGNKGISNNMVGQVMLVNIG